VTRLTTLELQASLNVKSSVFLWYTYLTKTIALVEVAIWLMVLKVSWEE
jgi:hypothetical protein